MAEPTCSCMVWRDPNGTAHKRQIPPQERMTSRWNLSPRCRVVGEMPGPPSAQECCGHPGPEKAHGAGMAAPPLGAVGSEVSTYCSDSQSLSLAYMYKSWHLGQHS